MSNFCTAKTSETTIINRREIEPLQHRASQIMEFYEKAVGCRTLILDRFGNTVNTLNSTNPSFFCKWCRVYYPDSSRIWGKCECPCMGIHIEAQSRAQRKGSYIYTCEIGFSYWTSSLYAGGRYAGSLIAGQVLAVSREKAADQFCSRYRAPRIEIMELLSAIPEKNHDEIIAMARMLLICAGKLSFWPGNNTQTLGGRLSMKFAENPQTGEKKSEKAWAYPQDKERTFLAALRRGDKNTAQKILNELFDLIQETEPGDFNSIRLFSIELAVLLSRAAGGELEGCYYRYLRQLQESQTVDQLKENLQSIANHIGHKIFSFQGIRHAAALRKAERFIWENYTHKISLQEIAGVSGLSAPYFSTVFKEEMGINLSTYLNKLRVDKAEAMLTETHLPIKEIAAACGFEDQSWFSKIFKSRTSISPGKYREQGNRKPAGAIK